MSTAAKVREMKLARYRQALKDDPHARLAFTALDAVAAATNDLQTRRASLEESGLLTSAGVYAQLKEFRTQHAAKLREHSEALRAAAEKVVEHGTPKIDAPADAQRILDHYLAQTPARRQQMRLDACAGRDDDLARVLVQPTNQRYAELGDDLRAHIERRLSNPSDEHRPRLDVLLTANTLVEETLATLEQ